LNRIGVKTTGIRKYLPAKEKQILVRRKRLLVRSPDVLVRTKFKHFTCLLMYKCLFIIIK
jgi:hypothetical protein